MGLEEIGGPSGDVVGFKFSPNNLWVDKVTAINQAELWFEIVTNDTEKAAIVLYETGVVRCDDIEDLGENFDGCWISSPCSIIHLVDAKDDHGNSRLRLLQ